MEGGSIAVPVTPEACLHYRPAVTTTDLEPQDQGCDDAQVVIESEEWSLLPPRVRIAAVGPDGSAHVTACSMGYHTLVGA